MKYDFRMKNYVVSDMLQKTRICKPILITLPANIELQKRWPRPLSK